MRALVLDDDRRLARFLARVLREEGFETDSCFRAEDAVLRAQRVSYELVILDWMLPDADGLEVCRAMRQRGGTMPILMLTARGAIEDRVRAFEEGVDDYLVKPFELDELRARARALWRRYTGVSLRRCGDLELDPIARRATASGVPLELTNREYAVLKYLVQNADRTVGRDELIASVWGAPYERGSNLVEVHVSRLRQKLAGAMARIETVRGFGYCLRGGSSSNPAPDLGSDSASPERSERRPRSSSDD